MKIDICSPLLLQFPNLQNQQKRWGKQTRHTTMRNVFFITLNTPTINESFIQHYYFFYFQ